MSSQNVTVIIPCHNHAQWVMTAVWSVVAQDHPSKRIVVVDDGSTDGSSEKVLAGLVDVKTPTQQGEPWTCLGTVAGSDTQLMLSRFREAHGPSFARNWGIKSGWEGTDAFMFLDSDDVYLPGKMPRSVAKWAEAPEHVGGVYSDYETSNENTGLRIRHYKEPFSRDRLVRECLPNMDSLVSRLALEQCGLFDETMRCCEDYDLWFRLSERFIVIHVPEPLLLLRVGTHSSSSTVNQETWQRCYANVFEKARFRSRTTNG